MLEHLRSRQQQTAPVPLSTRVLQSPLPQSHAPLFGPRPRVGPVTRRLAAVVGAMLVAGAGYRGLHAVGLDHSTLFFLGIPAVIALVVVCVAPRPGVVWTTAVTMTCALVAAGPMFNESVVSLLLAAPLFYAVAIGCALGSCSVRGSVVAVVVLVALGLEGLAFSLPRTTAVAVTRTVPGTPQQVAHALAGPPRFATRRPPVLRLGFPRPSHVRGGGLAVGSVRTVEFNRHGPLGLGAQRTPRLLKLRVRERTDRRVLFHVTDDHALANWVDLRSSEVTWRAVPGGRTEVTWRLDYRRRFDPDWYFGPLQSYGAHRAAGYLASAFTP